MIKMPVFEMDVLTNMRSTLTLGFFSGGGCGVATVRIGVAAGGGGGGGCGRRGAGGGGGGAARAAGEGRISGDGSTTPPSPGRLRLPAALKSCTTDTVFCGIQHLLFLQ